MDLFSTHTGIFAGHVESMLPAYKPEQRRTCYRAVPYESGGFQLERVTWLTHDSYQVNVMPRVFDTEGDAERFVRAGQRGGANQEPLKARRGRPRKVDRLKEIEAERASG
jgi:hypothetical protein